MSARTWRTAGVDVTLVDAWPEHVETMRREGSWSPAWTAGSVQTPVRALHIGDVPQLVREQARSTSPSSQ